MSAFIDITGQRFGRLVAERFIEFRTYGTKRTDGRAAWQFRCDCGGEVVALAQTVKAKDYKGRGCRQCANRARVAHNYTHGQSETRLHRIWIGIRVRCNNPNDTSYRNYGGRGIFVSSAWDEFEPFRAWSEANGYADALELDRIDNDGPYAPDNCRWVDHKTNTRNTRRTRLVEYHGERMSVADAADRTGISRRTLTGRLNRGMTIEEAVARPSDPCAV